MKVKKLITLVLVVALIATCFTTLAACGKTEDKTLVVGYSRFSQKFSPFFATTGYDQDAAAMTQLSLLTTDRAGSIVYNGIKGETRDYNGTNYTYTGIADISVDIKADTTVYTITLKDGVKFSDGVAMTTDDIIFSMYVLLDPTYYGSTTLNSLDIVGYDAYRKVSEKFIALIDTIVSDYDKDYMAGNAVVFDAAKAAEGGYTEDQFKLVWTDSFIKTVDESVTLLAQSITDYVFTNYISYAGAIGSTADAISANEGLKVALGMRMWGFAGYKDGVLTDVTGKTYDLTSTFPTVADYSNALLAAYSEDGLSAMFGTESTGAGEDSAITAAKGTLVGSMLAADTTGADVKNIEGIKKVGKNQVTVTTNGYFCTDIYQIGVSVAPMHYYGDKALYDYDNNKFGFNKGDLSLIESKTTTPMGAGAYKFVKYENGVIYYEANTSYYKGAPKTKYINFQETDDSDKEPGIVAGTFDVTDPSFSTEVAKAIEEVNSNKELTGDKITTSLVDNLGYGYIGISSDRVKVGLEKDSEASKNLRKAFAVALAYYRETAIESYYGTRATVINYPISNTSWAAPQANDEGYEIAFSKDVNGNDIYATGATTADKEAALKTAILGYLEAAGYTVSGGKVTEAPKGARLSYELLIPGDGTGDHPSFMIVTYASQILKDLGITLTVNDLSDSTILWDKLDAGECDMWAAAWGATVDPDMYQVYYSTNILKSLGGSSSSTESNKYCITDDKLDELIIEARKSADQTERKAIYKEALDIVLEWAVEIPIYQRKNAVIFSTERVNMATVTPDITTFYGWMSEVETLQMN